MLVVARCSQYNDDVVYALRDCGVSSKLSIASILTSSGESCRHGNDVQPYHKDLHLYLRFPL